MASNSGLPNSLPIAIWLLPEVKAICPPTTSAYCLMFLNTKYREDLLNLNQIYWNKLLMVFDLLRCLCSLALESGRFQPHVCSPTQSASRAPRRRRRSWPASRRPSRKSSSCHCYHATAPRHQENPMARRKGAVAVWLEIVLWIQQIGRLR